MSNEPNTDITTEPAEKSVKVMITISMQENNDLQDLRGELRKCGIETKIPPTAYVAQKAFKLGLAAMKTELRDLKKKP